MMYLVLIVLSEKLVIFMMEVNGLLICLFKMLLEMDLEELLGYLFIMEEVVDGVLYPMEDLDWF